jgi:hypothetical protein
VGCGYVTALAHRFASLNVTDRRGGIMQLRVTNPRFITRRDDEKLELRQIQSRPSLTDVNDPKKEL